ncbi:6-phosphogluconolactonase [Magnetofaba australis]|uniref:6-phosphogluconolactonase n=1 Tax=Magnetofaba australis IT-1 TaxID=1434232 RepID=A0A1Y2K9P9_9PROT|nr:6-phosphogluconolactonase [Magnetofaba australis]OSM07227.1 putative 6-phosphogluconolactonase [Magnetofaba australis IT-1]
MPSEAPNIQICADADAAALALAEALLAALTAHDASEPLSLVVSGGGTPERLFRLLGGAWRARIPWRKLALYWVDERCVAPDDPQSNHGMLLRAFGGALPADLAAYQRMRGEDPPQQEAARYAALLPPRLDWIWLGMGDDGHTASLFPGEAAGGGRCHGARNPLSGQARITLSEQEILRAERVTFLVTGASKSATLQTVLSDLQCDLPAARIARARRVGWLLDADSAPPYLQ